MPSPGGRGGTNRALVQQRKTLTDTPRFLLLDLIDRNALYYVRPIGEWYATRYRRTVDRCFSQFEEEGRLCWFYW
jgi:hypothetical protein